MNILILYLRLYFIFRCLSLLFLCFRFYLLITRATYVLELNFLTNLEINISLTVLLDPFSLMFSRIVLFISSIILKYRRRYIVIDRRRIRFLITLLFFIFSIIFIIFGINLIFIVLGWDGLGVTSYLLVIYYLNSNSSFAGIVTVLRNRVGDGFLLLAVAIIAESIRWNFLDKRYLICVSNRFILRALIILISITKRAQIPFSA